MVVLRLLGHRERPGNRDLDRALGERAEELDVAHLDGLPSPDRSDDPRNGVLVPRAIERDAGMVEVDAVERSREAVRVALPPHLAVADDVDSGSLQIQDGEPGRIVLRFLEERLRDAPELARADARRQPLSEPLAVDQPAGLWIASDDCRNEGAPSHHAIRPLPTLPLARAGPSRWRVSHRRRWPPTRGRRRGASRRLRADAARSRRHRR